MHDGAHGVLLAAAGLAGGDGGRSGDGSEAGRGLEDRTA
jgi:hypothetical protein